ncbi:chemotaxis protein CheA [Desulfuromonas sp. AOP6]|uniref:chemotaxis protein CheA n=1 Tax=Desulfuromonas sp. AOP6 TaxID=1566351 RepID=UPI00127A89A9|nr:chemotaxis protein CheA [Desulfuromonas sp. AOP6]BCA81040.1 chemotaxis protein CheA [Desulfuromonas sp. AOP6]
MDMSKYKEMFLSETAEHLEKMGQLIVALEADPADKAGIDALFREAHSIKGMAASMGYEQTAKLSHHLEDYMAGFRQSGRVPVEAVDRLMAGLDLLEKLLEDLKASQPEREVADFLASPLAPAGPGGGPSVPLQGIQVAIEFAENTEMPAIRAMLLLKELASVGTVLASKPTAATLRQGGALRRLHVLLDTELAADDLRAALLRNRDVSRVAIRQTAAKVSPKEPSAPGSSPQVPARARQKQEAVRSVRVRTDLLDRFIQLTGELITNRYQLFSASQVESWDGLRDGLDELNRLISELYHDVLQVRMMPLESITGRLPRLVRDLARSTGKKVSLQLAGENIELDRAILEELADPLVHMVRNAVDHGIEKAGEVRVAAWREKDLALVEIADNGRGMDPENLRRRAVEKGLLSSAQARSMRDADALQLICYPGFSTAPTVTETSGRGVGMDVVKSAVESLGGTLEIFSSHGQGTRFLLKLPLSVAIIHILLVRCHEQLIGIPVTRVQRSVEVTPEEILSSGRQKVIRLVENYGEEEPVEVDIPLLSLRKMLGLPARPFSGSIPVVLTEIRGRRVGLVVDKLAGHRQVFVQSLAFPLDNLAGVSGATVLGDGHLVFIVDPSAMLDERYKPLTAPPPGGFR